MRLYKAPYIPPRVNFYDRSKKIKRKKINHDLMDFFERFYNANVRLSVAIACYKSVKRMVRIF